jgi:flavin reductase (DIM6/NTAB) family NADH-FMN oxidoreductase RutF
VQPLDRAEFLDAMRRAATPVSVITTDGPGGRLGVTVSSVCTASADPPQMLACIHGQSITLPAIRANGVFCVNILGSSHRHVADSFAGRIERWRNDRFACDRWTTLLSGAPVLEEALVALDCRLEQELVASSHAILVGTVVAVRTRDGPPLLYSNRDYGRLADPLHGRPEDMQL